MTTIEMTQEEAQYSLWEALGADNLVASEIRQSFLEFEAAAPFDRIATDYDIDTVIWEKTFDTGYSDVVPFLISRAYLIALMPELTSIHPGAEGIVLVCWQTNSVHDVIRDAFNSMSPTTKSLLVGEVTLKQVIEDFFTPERVAKTEALISARKPLPKSEIVRVLMEGESVALTDGAL